MNCQQLINYRFTAVCFAEVQEERTEQGKLVAV